MPSSGSVISSGSYRRTATTSCFCARRAIDASQPDSLMKSETMKTAERRLIDGRARSIRSASRVVPLAADDGRARMRCIRCSTCMRPLLAGSTVSSELP